MTGLQAKRKQKVRMTGMELKLNTRQTICVGFAFFLISAFWQAYDNTIPMILTNKFGMNQTWSGFIMAFDNILALFLLPLFGKLSDRTRTRLGRRTPYILFGTLAAVTAFFFLSVADMMQLRLLGDAARINDPYGLQLIYRAEKKTELISPEGETFVLQDTFSEDEFKTIRTRIYPENNVAMANPLFTQVVVPAGQAYARRVTHENGQILILFICLLLATLVAMATFRSPAVALMPDVTLKPLRSRANAIITLMGSAGGILVLLLGVLFRTSAAENLTMGYMPFFSAVSGIMLLALVFFLFTVREPQLVQKMQKDSETYGISNETQSPADTAHKKLNAAEKKSLFFILASIVLWFMGYNAVASKYSVYATTLLRKNYNLTLLIAQAAAIVSYIPVGIVASRVGRKKTILAGILMLTAAFGAASLMREDSPALLMNALFALAGMGWATINVNSFPMVVEMCSEADVGWFTGIYYAASMSAQIITPVLSGMIMDRFGLTALFPYSVVFVALAFVTMLFVRHGDSKPAAHIDLSAMQTPDGD